MGAIVVDGKVTPLPTIERNDMEKDEDKVTGVLDIKENGEDKTKI